MKYLDMTQQQGVFGGNASLRYAAVFTLSVIAVLIDSERSRFIREKAYLDGFRDGIIKGIDAAAQGRDAHLFP